jgi:hypothetical protein
VIRSPSSPNECLPTPPTQSTREKAIRGAVASAVIPGLGQLLQRRFGAALLQCGTVAAYLIASGSLGGRHAMFLAAFWNLWSVVDAYRHSRD